MLRPLRILQGSCDSPLLNSESHHLPLLPPQMVNYVLTLLKPVQMDPTLPHGITCLTNQ